MENQDFIAKWKNWIELFIINDIKRALEKDALEVGLIILTLLGIECLSAYYTGRRDSSLSTFQKFLKKYFPPAYVQYGDKIYLSLRHGLAHSYIPSKLVINSVEVTPFVMCRSQGEPHLTPCQAGRDFPVWFNREIFARDFLAAWDKYAKDLDTDVQLQKNTIARAQKGFLVVDDVSKFLGL